MCGAELPHFGGERVVSGTCGVHPEDLAAGAVEGVQHREHRGDADAARTAGSPVRRREQREVASRSSDFESVADLHVIVEPGADHAVAFDADPVRVRRRSSSSARLPARGRSGTDQVQGRAKPSPVRWNDDTDGLSGMIASTRNGRKPLPVERVQAPQASAGRGTDRCQPGLRRGCRRPVRAARCRGPAGTAARRSSATLIRCRPTLGAHDLVACLDFALGDDAQVEAGAAVRDHQRRHSRLVQPHADAVARDARLGDLELGRADAVPVADVQTSSSGRPSTVKFSPNWPYSNVAAQLRPPVFVRLSLVDKNSAVLAAVAAEIALAVTVDVEPADRPTAR